MHPDLEDFLMAADATRDRSNDGHICDGNRGHSAEDCTAANTDRELFRESDFYSPSVHVTKDGKIGMNVGGIVHVLSIQDWHALIPQDPRTKKPYEHTVPVWLG